MLRVLNYITEIIQVTRVGNELLESRQDGQRFDKKKKKYIYIYIFKISFEFVVVVIKGPKYVFEVLKVTSIWRKILLEWYCVICNVQFHIESKITYIRKQSSHEKQTQMFMDFEIILVP